MIDNRTVGKTIASLRQARGMTQQQLAAALNVSHQAVSKWENGAALPDIQTLHELTQFFGVTFEQLVSGDVPGHSPESETPSAIQSIGRFVNGVIDDIGNIFKSEPASIPDEARDDGAVEAEVVDDSAAPVKDVDISKLLEMAPFMSRQALAEMLAKPHRKLTLEEIAAFAPSVSSTCLENLLMESEDELSWDILRRVAPFLKKDAVDAFTKMIVTGEKPVRPAPDDAARAVDDMHRALDDVSKKLGHHVDKAVQKVVRIGESVGREVGKAFDGLTIDTPSREERLAKLRRSAFERALDDGKWEWIEAHISELTDSALKRRIAERANQLNMQDWVRKNLGGYADARTIEEAVESGDWGWLGDHVWEFEAELQHYVAKAAMKAENWQWLSSYAEQLDLKDCVVEIAGAARRSGARMLAAQLAHYDMQPQQIEESALEAIGAGDFEFLELVQDFLPADAMCRCCIRLAKSGDWESAVRFAAKLDSKGLEWLIEIAIDAGNFDALDRFTDILNEEHTEVKEHE